MNVRLILTLAFAALFSFTLLQIAYSTPTLTADDFFISLIENKADLTEGVAIFKINNPTSTAIPINSNTLNFRIEYEDGATAIQKISFFVLQNISYSQNITDYATACDPYSLTNGTQIDNCTSLATGWHWNNYTIEKFIPLDSLSLEHGQTSIVKAIISWSPKLGLNSKEWFPQLTVDGITYEQSKWASWNTSWQKRNNITITNGAASILNNYSVSVNVNYNASMVSDFSDLRFTWFNSTDSTETEIPYFIEDKVNSAWAYIWVKVPQVPASSNTTVSMYYKNTTVVNTTSNGPNTFLFFDNAETGVITDNWAQQSGSSSYSTAQAKYGGKSILLDATSGYSRIYKSVTPSDGKTVEYWLYEDGDTQSNINRYAIFYNSTSVVGAYGAITSVHTTNYAALMGGWVNTGLARSGNNWVHISLNWSSSNQYTVCKNRYVSCYTGSKQTSNVNPDTLRLFEEDAAGSNRVMYVDNFIYREYVSPEPSLSIGEEEFVNDPPIFFDNNSSTPGVYSLTTASQFNVTWRDDFDANGFNVSLLEIDFSGSFRNYTMNRDQNTSYFPIILPAGTFAWRVYANDSANAFNSTTQLTFTIIKGTSNVTLFLDSFPNNKTALVGDIVNITAIANHTQGNISIFSNGTLLQACTSQA